MIRIPARALLALGILLATLPLGCGTDPTGDGPPVPGEMVAALGSPFGAEGSAVLEVASGTVTGVSSDDPDLLVYRIATQPVRIVVLRGTPGALAFRLSTDDVHHPPELRVVEVGGPDDAIRGSVSGYAVALVPGEGS